VSTFWKPLSRDRAPGPPGGRLKHLGTGVYQLWARCDLCHYSAPFDEFVLWERGTDVGSLCGSCDAREEITSELEQDGWRRCG
jgi:hypothetical protein